MIFQYRNYKNLAWSNLFLNIDKKLKVEKERSNFDGKAVLILDGCHTAALKQYNLDEKN